MRIGLSRRHRKRLRMILPPEFCQRGDAQIGKLAGGADGVAEMPVAVIAALD